VVAFLPGQQDRAFLPPPPPHPFGTALENPSLELAPLHGPRPLPLLFFFAAPPRRRNDFSRLVREARDDALLFLALTSRAVFFLGGEPGGCLLGLFLVFSCSAPLFGVALPGAFRGHMLRQTGFFRFFPPFESIQPWFLSFPDDSCRFLPGL